MALDLIKVCRARNIDCVVAPYEADAQLAYLAIQGSIYIDYRNSNHLIQNFASLGIAHVVITEDSDLLAFGCPRVFFKMDHSGKGVLIEKDRLNLSLGDRADFFNQEKYVSASLSDFFYQF